VLNHTSSEHPWFKHAAADPASPWRDWFLWTPANPGVKGPWGQEVWYRSPSRDEHYFAVFWSGMPDLNFANPEVRGFARDAARFWLQEMGVDGFRLDAVAHFVEAGGQMKHAPGTFPVLRELAAAVREISPNAFTIGEVWDSTGAMLPYYPDQLDAYFAFEGADAMLEAVRTGSAQKLFPAFLRLQRDIPGHRWAPFLRNHDQPRTMTELGGDFAKARLAATFLLTMPGTPFVYYGEEIGMTGGKPDPRIRTPMHWSRGPAAGFTRGLPWEPLHADSLTANVEAQSADAGSLLNLHRQLIHARTASAALAGGDLVPLTASTDVVAAYLRRRGGRAVLVIANLGTAPLTGVTLSSDGRVLPAGRYTGASLIGGPAAAPLVVRRDGSIRGYVPLPRLGPMESHVIDLTR
jgi:alpha-amylase